MDFADYCKNPVYAYLTVVIFVAMRLAIKFLQEYLLLKAFLLLVESLSWKREILVGRVIFSKPALDKGLPSAVVSEPCSCLPRPRLLPVVMVKFLCQLD